MAARRVLLWFPLFTACAAAPEEVARPPVAAPAPPLPPEPEPIPPGRQPEARQELTPVQEALDLLAAGQEARGLAGLREEMATGEGHLEAALALASYLASRERLWEALAATEAGLARSPDQPGLARARANLLRNLGQREPALQALRDIAAQSDSEPTLWLQVAELEWLQGGREAALAALEHLRSRFGDHPWVEENRAGLSNLEEEIAASPAPRTISQRDLLGNLRGADSGIERFRALRLLAEEGGELRRQAVDIALNDPDAALRVQALRLGEWTLAESERFARAALVDPAPSVRVAALPLCRRIDPQIAGPLIFAALSRETDPDSFRLMHEALEEIRAVHVYLPPGASDDDAGRAAVVARWKEIIDSETRPEAAPWRR